MMQTPPVYSRPRSVCCFQTYIDKAAQLAAWEPITVFMWLMIATDVAGNARHLRIGQWLQSMTEAPTQVKLAAIQA
jgi:hypothetical protein